MRVHQITIMVGVACLVALLIPLLVYRQVQFAPKLKDTEKAVAAFKPSTLQVPSVAWQPVQLRLPVTSQPPPAAPPLPGTSVAPLPTLPVTPAQLPPPTVSFILNDGGKDMAIINGAVLKVGDRYQDWRVARIERNRVLLTGRKGPLWLTLQ